MEQKPESLPPFARIRRAGENIFHHELALLLAVAIIAGGLWVFLGVASEVAEGDTHAIDRQLILALRPNPADLGDPIGPPWFEEMMRDFTALGGLGILTLLTLSVFGFLLLEGKNNGAFYVLAVVAGGMVLSLLLKTAYNRPRPDLVPYGSVVSYASFPSGHSMLSAATYLTLGALLARLQAKRHMKIYILSLAILVTVLVGVSRVYLGVHWPTDVVAGWAAGAVWASACWLGARWLQRRGQVETPENSPAPATTQQHESLTRSQ